MPFLPRPPKAAVHRTAALLCALLFAGCQPVMTTSAMPSHDASPSDDGSYSNYPAVWPLKFRGHQFGAFSYSTYGCKVYYRGMPQLDEPDDVLQISSDSVANYPSNLNGSWGPITNFPPPAKVTWRSKDGTPHEAEVDLGEIFKDQLIRHNVPRDEASDPATDGLPEIILEVNDRTINVYMRATIWTKEEQIPGNRFSRSRNDLIKVYSRSY
jgi:hypothetical protein